MFNSLKYKIASAIFIMLIVILSLIIWESLENSYKKNRHEVDSVKETILKLLNISAREALFSKEYDAIQSRMESIASDPYIENIYLEDNRSIVVASNHLDRLGRSVPDIKNNKNKPIRVKKISNITGVMGNLYVQYSFSDQSGVDKAILFKTLILGLGGTFLIAGMSFLSGAFLTRRLDILTRSAVNISKGDYHARTNFSGQDEISILGKRFDEMARYIEAEQKKSNQLSISLEKRIAERTKDYEIANKELESFCYAVSHDLRAPLRSIDGFSLALVEDYSDIVDDGGKNYINRIRQNSEHMSELIDSLLELSKVNQLPVEKKQVDLSEICSIILDRLKEQYDKREVEIKIEKNVYALVDKKLIFIVLENLLNNSWKYTQSINSKSIIEFGCEINNEHTVYFVKDNGVGFNMKYYDKLFEVFQRLHSSSEFEGAGVGLSTVKRIINHHGGDIWAESEINKGSCFFFTVNIRRE